MDFPDSLGLDAKGNLWAADTGNSRFAIFKPDGTFVDYWEHRGSGDGQYILTRSNGDGFGAIAFAPDGSFYVLDVGNHRVEHFAADRNFLKAWGGFGSGVGQFLDPIGLAVGPGGVVYVLDDGRDVIERYDSDGKVLGHITAYPDAPPGYESAGTFVVDNAGNAYTATFRVGSHVRKIDPSGAVLVTYGSAEAGPGYLTGQPSAGAVDSAGRLFVADGPSVLVFGSDGSFVSSFTAPGLAHEPNGFVTALLLDGLGNGYVAESSSSVVEKFRLLPPLGP